MSGLHNLMYAQWQHAVLSFMVGRGDMSRLVPLFSGGDGKYLTRVKFGAKVW